MKSLFLTSLLLFSTVPLLAIDQDSGRYDRNVRGKPFTLEEIFGDEVLDGEPVVPEWVESGKVSVDTVYWGIGMSKLSQEEADDLARLAFARMVEVKVSSMARQAYQESQESLTESYSFESLVSTDLALRGILVTEQYEEEDGTFYSLIRYGKHQYHNLVTQEIAARLQAEIAQTRAALAAVEALEADSLRHKMAMDSLAHAREQAVLDSIQKKLNMEREAVEQAEERIKNLQRKYADFLDLDPYHRLIDVPTAGLPSGYGELLVRWNTMNQNFNELKLTGSISLLELQLGLRMDEFDLDQAELGVRLQILPPRGELYRVSLTLGLVSYIRDAGYLELNMGELGSYGDAFQQIGNPDEIFADQLASSALITGNVGIPQLGMNVSLYADKRRISIGEAWYPLVRHLGDAIALVGQVDFFLDEAYRNRFGDPVEFLGGLRIVAIPGRFATLIAYEDNEWWRLTFELQL